MASRSSGFRSMDIYPTQSEMLGARTTLLRKNVIEGPFRNVEDYLDIHFKLLREDFVTTVREGISQYRANKEVSSLDIYKNVKISTLRRDTVITLDFRVKCADLENSKKFLNGSLLIFTKDNFVTTFFAKVVRRDNADFANRNIFIEFVGPDTKQIGTNFTMAECRSFFEPYFQVLRVLKKINEDDFPMEKYIIQANTSTALPGYLSGKTYKIDSKITDLNEAQIVALKAALTQEFVVIQGPPGTGKTYLGIKIVKTLLENHHFWYHNSPILVISHKNHALDQFLEGLVPFTKRLVRVGGQSKCKALEAYNLAKLTEIEDITKNLTCIGFDSQSDSDLDFDVDLDYWTDSKRRRTDSEVLKEALVVGMTTTCAARMKETLDQVKSPIMIVEEAAEVLEAHVIAALGQNCQHLILLGDHLQLQPSTSDRDIAKKYHLGVSLFERMVNNGIHCYQLNVQHRMRPEISDMLKAIIYPFLKDHDSVLTKGPVLGIDKNVFFIDHRHPEEASNVTSKKNNHEAAFIVAFAKYLIQNGYKSDNVTILTTYAGQVREIKNEVRKLAQKEWLNNVRISTLDSFQGQESEIILLSLVRSEGIGFLAAENRVCVALSRAKNGFYMIGNMDLFSKSSKMWTTIRERLVKQQALGAELTLRCQKHPEIATKVKSASDFKKVPCGGCTKKCENPKLPCGHLCSLTCHILPHREYPYQCKNICGRSICETHKLEKCGNLCFEDCEGCKFLVLKTFDCGHRLLTKCSTSSTMRCPKHEESSDESSAS